MNRDMLNVDFIYYLLNLLFKSYSCLELIRRTTACITNLSSQVLDELTFHQGFSIEVGKDDLLPVDPDAMCLKSVVFACASEIQARFT